MCKGVAEQVIPKGYDYRVVELQCGNTGYYGEPIFCEECEAANKKRGHRPNECKHGVNIWDGFCTICEFE